MTIPCAHQGRPRCWSCMTNDCYDQPNLHVWWNFEDVEHAEATGQPKPTGWCGCAFCGYPAVDRAPMGDQT
jgi:hypothetical protein